MLVIIHLTCCKNKKYQIKDLNKTIVKRMKRHMIKPKNVIQKKNKYHSVWTFTSIRIGIEKLPASSALWDGLITTRHE